MTGPFLVPIITPIVAIIALAIWLGMVYWAEAHPGWKAHGTAPGPGITGVSLPTAAEPGEHHRGDLAPSPDRKAA